MSHETQTAYAAELDAAAEILQRVHPIGRVKAIGRLEVVAALGELFPADEFIAVDEAWLRSVGFLPDGDDPETGDFATKIWSRDEHSDYGKDPAMHVIQNVKDGSSWLESYSPQGQSLCIIELEPKPTRGDVRRLLAALGIELAERSKSR